MPCTFTGTLDGDRLLAAKEALDARERMLCAVCKTLEKNLGSRLAWDLLIEAAVDADGLGSADILDWWRDHKEADERRGQ